MIYLSTGEINFRIADFFAGTGGFSLGKHNYVFANDNASESHIIYKENFKDNHFSSQDILNLPISSLPSFDILCGGFPCQPFSVAGKRQGFDDERSNVFWKVIKILQEKRPRFFILENVKNILTHNSSQTLEKIKDAFSNISYSVEIQQVNTSLHTSIPQNRERVFFIGFRDSEDHKLYDLDLNVCENTKDVCSFLEDPKDISQKYIYKNNVKIWKKLKENVKEPISSQVVYQYRRTHIRKNKKGVCPTLTANMGSGGHNVPIILDDRFDKPVIRKLTPRECFNLQGFPKTYILPSSLSDSKLYKLAGNAITIPIVNIFFQKLEDIF